MSKIVQDKIQFYGGWFLLVLASFGTIYIVIPDSLGQLEALDRQIIMPIIIMLILPMGLLFLYGSQFIEKGLQEKQESQQ